MVNSGSPKAIWNALKGVWFPALLVVDEVLHSLDYWDGFNFISEARWRTNFCQYVQKNLLKDKD